MQKIIHSRLVSPLMVLIGAITLGWGVLSFYRTTDAGAQAPVEPFANAVAQRSEMIACLKEIRDLLKEQNALLKSGSLQVVVAAPEHKQR